MKQSSSNRKVNEQAREVIAGILLFEISDPRLAVSYTHLTLPTNSEVYISVDAVSLKKKKKTLINISSSPL